MWDDGEVRKILTAAQWVLDRLGLVQGAKSMRGLVICFGVSRLYTCVYNVNFSDSSTSPDFPLSCGEIEVICKCME